MENYSCGRCKYFEMKPIETAWDIEVVYIPVCYRNLTPVLSIIKCDSFIEDVDVSD